MEKLAEEPVLVQIHFCLPDYRVTAQPGECGRQEGSRLSKNITYCMWSFPLILQGNVGFIQVFNCFEVRLLPSCGDIVPVATQTFISVAQQR